jgi:formylglycine-generating enzyme required for sulfatase activity
VYPYGNEYVQGVCNDGRSHPTLRLFRATAHPFSFAHMNDPRVNQQPDSLARVGEFEGCTNAYGVHDMVGNLHEWTAERHGRRGVFRGGFYVDVHEHGEGCRYRTTAHASQYHDYSIGFRCCADPRPAPRTSLWWREE